MNVIKKFRNEIISGTIIATLITASVFIEKYEKRFQKNEIVVDPTQLYYNDNQELCYYLEPGEHVLEISRNDAMYAEIEVPDGYEIQKVILNGYRDNNHIIYVNTEPVEIVANQKNNSITFDDFGKVVEFDKTYTYNK